MAGSLGGNLFEFPMIDNLPLPPMPQWSNLPGPTAPLPELDPEELFNEVAGTGSQGSPGSLQSSDSGVGSPEGSFPPESPGHQNQSVSSSTTSVPLGDASPVVSSSLPDVVTDSSDVVVLPSTSSPDEQQTNAQPIQQLGQIVPQQVVVNVSDMVQNYVASASPSAGGPIPNSLSVASVDQMQSMNLTHVATFQLPPQIPTQSAAAPYPHYYNPYQPLDIKPYQASLGQAIPAAVNQAPSPPPPYVQAAPSKQHQAATAGVGPAGTASSPTVPPEFQWVPYGGHHMQAAMYQAAAYHQPQVHHQGAAAAVAYHHQQQQQGAAPGFNPHQAGAMAAMGQHDPAVLQQHFHLTFQQQAGCMPGCRCANCVRKMYQQQHNPAVGVQRARAPNRRGPKAAGGAGTSGTSAGGRKKKVPEKENLSEEQLKKLKEAEWEQKVGFVCKHCNMRFTGQDGLVDHMASYCPNMKNAANTKNV